MLGRYRYAYLLATLALLIVARPFLPDLGRGLVIGMLILSLMTAAITSSTNRSQVWFGLGLVCVILVTSISPLQSGRLNLAILSPALGVAYWALIAFLILRKIFIHTQRVSVDTINGAICVYLILGIAWAQAYVILETLVPGSFSPSYDLVGSRARELGHVRELDGFIGFSFITLTTLGYGNVVPLTLKAEALTIAEAITGQLYLAVLLARLVAMEISSRRDG
ncbi:potassium channel family protein [Myxococcota bacterium]|nr:potassium channel family protein [Myxococcota bacterium]